MAEESRLQRFLRSKLRSVGRQAAQASEEYAASRGAARWGLPTDGEGRVPLVCRRHAEQRTVTVDLGGRPACYDAGHPDCQGCAEDVRDGRIETW